MKLVPIASILSLLFVSPSHSQVKLDGYFIAFQSCEAYQSKNKQTNPGEVKSEPHKAYEIMGLNKKEGDYFLIRIPDAPKTTERWISVNCGLHVVAAGTNVVSQPDEPIVDEPVIIDPPQGSESDDHVLALSWQPAFCEKKPGKTECKQLNEGLLPLTEKQLSIHGLWPQPRGNTYCGVAQALITADKNNRWNDLPEIQLDSETRDSLAVLMPGTASELDRHEWIKHGTCHMAVGGADEYYDDTLLITKEINASVVTSYLSQNLGNEVSTKNIRSKFDEAFGHGAGNKVRFHCTGDGSRVLIQELTINLKGIINIDTSVKSLIQAAKSQTIGCKKGYIDAAGLQ